MNAIKIQFNVYPLQRMRPRALPPGRGISPRPRAPLAIRAVDEGRARRESPSQRKRKLKAVMQLSRIAVSAHRPGTAEAAPSPWKKAKIFPMMLQKVKGKDADYDKLMAARQVDGEDSMVIKGSYFQKTASDRPSAKKLDRALKGISVSKKMKPPTAEEISESDSKSGISISVTTESEPVTEDSDYVKKKRRRPSSSSVESSVSSTSASRSDKDYLKVTLDETTESTVDSDEENGDSDSSGSESESGSGSTSSSSSEEESSDSQSKVSETEEEDTESKVSSSAISSVSTNVTLKSETHKSSRSNIKDQSSTAGSELDDTVEELSDEGPPSAVEEEENVHEVSSTNTKTASSTQKDSSDGEPGLSEHDTERITGSAASGSETPSDLTSF